MTKLAAKLLAEVEVSASASNQHELNAGTLRKALGFQETPVVGELELNFLTADGETPVGETARYTLYNARAGQPRAPEYRLYYSSDLLQDSALPGDILFIARADESDALKALVVRPGTSLGQSMLAVLNNAHLPLYRRFRSLATLVSGADLEHLLHASSDTARVPDAGVIVEACDPEVVAAVLQTGALPLTDAMADLAHRVGRKLGAASLDPDTELCWHLEIETALFSYLENRLGQAALDALAAGGRIAFEDATALIMSQLQSRRSRRGLSLQHHFRKLLEGRNIPFTAQCKTERGETPDFVFPGCAQYADPLFPAERLRMVAAKSTIKERWGQILKEADRIPSKFVLTLDGKMTDSVIARMTENQLVVHLPRQLVEVHYAGREGATHLRTVSQLVDSLVS